MLGDDAVVVTYNASARCSGSGHPAAAPVGAKGCIRSVCFIRTIPPTAAGESRVRGRTHAQTWYQALTCCMHIPATWLISNVVHLYVCVPHVCPYTLHVHLFYDLGVFFAADRHHTDICICMYRCLPSHTYLQYRVHSVRTGRM